MFCPVDQKQYDEEYINKYWTPLRITIESFLQPEPNSGLSSFHQTFSLIYECVCNGRATKLYMDLLELCSSHLKTVHVHLMNLLTADQTNTQVSYFFQAARPKIFQGVLPFHLNNLASVCFLSARENM